MPVSTQTLLTISPALPAKNLQELKQILDIVVFGAFGLQTNFRTVLIESADHAVLGLDFAPDVQPCILVELTIRLAATTLQLVTALAKELGVPTRQSGVPYCRMLKLPGLTWHHVRFRLSRLVSTLESPSSMVLVCANTALHLRITTGRPLGYSAHPSAYLCGTVIRRRVTSGGEIVRIRCGRRPMSIAIPRDISATAVSDGMVIATAPIVSQIPRRLVQMRRCQLSLFSDLDNA